MLYDIVLGTIMTIKVYKNARNNHRVEKVGALFGLLSIVIAELFFLKLATDIKKKNRELA